MKFELEPDRRNITDKELLDDLMNVANRIGLRSVKMRDYDRIGIFSSGTIAKRFGGWNKALEKAGLKISKRFNISDSELISDVKRVADEIAPQRLTQKIYDEKGEYTSTTINERLGWNKTLEQLNLDVSLRFNISEEELFKNIETVWIKLGHAPGRRDMIKPLSRYSEGPYKNRYGTWRKALEAFVEYINADSKQSPEVEEDVEDTSVTERAKVPFRHKTKRDISDRLKVRVLIRDGNKCRLCGVTLTGDNIHFDHIKPWSKGGETVAKNLQVLCAKHNLAKGDFYEGN